MKDGMASHSSTLAWRTPWTEEAGGLQSVGSQSLTQLKRLSKHVHSLCYSLLSAIWWPVNSRHLALSSQLSQASGLFRFLFPVLKLLGCYQVVRWGKQCFLHFVCFLIAFKTRVKSGSCYSITARTSLSLDFDLHVSATGS